MLLFSLVALTTQINMIRVIMIIAFIVIMIIMIRVIMIIMIRVILIIMIRVIMIIMIRVILISTQERGDDQSRRILESACSWKIQVITIISIIFLIIKIIIPLRLLQRKCVVLSPFMYVIAIIPFYSLK